MVEFVKIALNSETGQKMLNIDEGYDSNERQPFIINPYCRNGAAVRHACTI